MAEQEHQQQHPFPLLNLIVTEPFYAFHGLAFFSYLVIRQSTAQWLSEGFSHHLLRREIQALLTFGVLATIKMVKIKTWEAFIADTLFYAKGFLIMLASILDRRLAVCYISLMSATTLQWSRECQSYDSTPVRDHPYGREHLEIMAGLFITGEEFLISLKCIMDSFCKIGHE